jgi:hypothetical protein
MGRERRIPPLRSELRHQRSRVYRRAGVSDRRWPSAMPERGTRRRCPTEAPVGDARPRHPSAMPDQGTRRRCPTEGAGCADPLGSDGAADGRRGRGGDGEAGASCARWHAPPKWAWRDGVRTARAAARARGADRTARQGQLLLPPVQQVRTRRAARQRATTQTRQRATLQRAAWNMQHATCNVAADCTGAFGDGAAAGN